jgi:glutamate synthase domain-containing protein 3
MNIICSRDIEFKALNEKIRASEGEIRLDDCCGQRFIGAALPDNKRLTINGTPGNALGAYLDGGIIEVNGNAQDAVGDTMNDGKIIVNGRAGDALGYAMRGGSIFIRGDAGYRAGVHMKAYQERKPAIVIGGTAGSFLGEYLAGGVIVVLGLGAEDKIPVGNFTGTGMHGGEIFIRTDKDLSTGLPPQVMSDIAAKDDLHRVEPYIEDFAKLFGVDAKALLKDRFYILKPNAKNPYKQMYTAN